MKKLDKFILKSYIGPFVLTFFIALFILLMQFLWRYLDEIVGKGLGIGVISELMLYACSSLVPMSLPLAVLLSSIMTFGNMAEHYELMAIKSAGISLVKIMRPLVIFVVGISICAFLFSNNIMPYTNLKMASLLNDIKHQKPEVSINEGVFSDAIDDYTIKVGRKSRKSPMLYDIIIYNHSEGNGNRDVTLADSGTMIMTADKRYMVLTLYGGANYVEETEKKRHRREDKEYPQRTTRFKEERFAIDMSGMGFERSDESLYKNGYAMLNLSQLQYTTDSLNTKFNNETNGYLSTLEKGNYFKKMNYNKEDSLWYQKTSNPASTYINIDSALMTLSMVNRQGVINYAMENARNAKSYITQAESTLQSRQKTIKRYEIEWHRKFTLSISCLLLFFIGAPLGAIIRKGGIGTPIVISVLFFVIYYVINISCEKSAKMGTWPVWLGMWISSMIFLPMGTFLTYKAVKDATFMELSTYTDFFRKVYGKFISNPQVQKLVARLKKNKKTDAPVNQ